MCYGTCSFEEYIGECSVYGISNQIKFELGFTPCFIDGHVNCKEEDEYYQELVKQGKIKELKEKVWNMRFPVKVSSVGFMNI